jgi:hypothetical protein
VKTEASAAGATPAGNPLCQLRPLACSSASEKQYPWRHLELSGHNSETVDVNNATRLLLFRFCNVPGCSAAAFIAFAIKHLLRQSRYGPLLGTASVTIKITT